MFVLVCVWLCDLPIHGCGYCKLVVRLDFGDVGLVHFVGLVWGSLDCWICVALFTLIVYVIRFALDLISG